MRRTFQLRPQFVHPRRGPLALSAAGEWVENGEPVAFTFHASPSGTDRIRITSRLHEIHGSPEGWARLADELERTRAVVRAEVELKVWPAGRPDTDDELLQVEQGRLMSEAWMLHRSPAMATLQHVQQLHDRIEFFALWETLWVSGPDHWRRLSEWELDDGVVLALMDAWGLAREEVAKGKGPPSAP
jgi:hypothetical protein